MAMPTSLIQMLELAGGGGLLAAAGIASGVVFAAAALHCRRQWARAEDDNRNAKALIENLSEGIYRSSLDGRQLSANPALVALNGYTSEAEMLAAVKDIGAEWYVDPRRRQEFRRILNAHGKIEDFVSEIYRHKTRERIWISESARLVFQKRTGKPLYYEGSVREITETVKRLKLEEHYQKLISQIPGGLFQYSREADGSFRLVYTSEGFRRLIGAPAHLPFEDPLEFVAMIVPDDLDGYNASLKASLRALAPWDHEFRILTPTGHETWLRASAAPEVDGDRVVWHGHASDISLRKRQEIEIRELAYFDPLTRLPNRRMLRDRLPLTLAKCRDEERHGAILFIDLDNFKTLNDTQGHDTGDAYLIQVAERLKGCVRDYDLVARIGGDEFVVILEEAGSDEAAATARATDVAGDILERLASPFQIGTVLHEASASVGVVVFDGREATADEILKRADIAMYSAKGAGRNAMAVFDPESMLIEKERYRMVAELRAAIAEDQFQLHFQPQVDRNGRIRAAEALLRWYHPEQGIIKPDRFIPLAEQAGLINDLGRLVLEKGVAALADWRRRPYSSELRLSLNISVRSFAGDDFLPHLVDLIAAHGVDASRLTLEFTEHVMAEDQADTARRMREAKRVGVNFSLDDFGTGYSSLGYLKLLPFDEIKIDGSFVSDLETKESDRVLVRTMLAMAETLGLTAVAEHVENPRQEAFLRAFGCDLFQGYFYSPPLDAAALLVHVAAADMDDDVGMLRSA